MNSIEIPAVGGIITVNVKHDPNARPYPEVVALYLLTPPLIGESPALIDGGNLYPAAVSHYAYRHTDYICLYLYFLRFLWPLGHSFYLFQHIGQDEAALRKYRRRAYFPCLLNRLVTKFELELLRRF